MGHNIGPYTYGISHTRMGRPIHVWANIRIWGRTLITPFQADLFRDFGSLGCVDSTHKTTEYGYKLITLVVADVYRNGNKDLLHV